MFFNGKQVEQNIILRAVSKLSGDAGSVSINVKA